MASFYACYSLVNVGMPSALTTISNSAFSACTQLPQINLPATALNLGERAFYYCRKLNNVVLPEGLKTIPSSMFRSCASLDSIAIPASVENVGSLAFSGCSALRAVRMPVNLVINSLPATVERFYYYYTLPAEWSTFCSDNALGFPKDCNVEAFIASTYEEGTVTLQQVEAVPAKTGLVLHGTAGEQVIFSKGANVAIQNLLVGLLKPTYVVPSTYAVTNFLLDEDNLKGLGFYPIPDDVIYEPYTAYLSLPVSPYAGDMVHIALGDNIIFADATVKELCVTNWDANGDGELSKTEAAAVTSLGTVFSGKSTIRTFEELKFFTGLIEIGDDAFSGCTALKSIELPNQVKTFGDNAFKDCRNIATINVPEELTSIGANCFNNCSALESINIPETVTSVGDDAFARCTKLTDVTVPAKLYVNSFPTTVTSYQFTLTLQEEYETFCSAYNLELVNAGGLQAFTTPLYKNGKIKMNRMNNVGAHTGVVLHGVPGKQYVMGLGIEADESLENLFIGVLEETNLSPVLGDDRIFCLMDGSQGYAFYPIDTDTVLEGNRAYLPLPEAEAIDVDYVLMSLLPDIDDPVIRVKKHREGIASSIGESEGDAADEWFTLTGAKLNGKPSQRGVYIHNGKKVTVK